MKIQNKLYITIFCILCVIIVQAAGKRILFIGDSITDGAWGKSKVWNTPSEERNQTDMNHIYGHGYMNICASYYQATFPDSDYVFWNRGISGNTLDDLRNRWDKDALNLKPDIVSILIGTNDAERYLMLDSGEPFDIKSWERKYRQLLDTTKTVLPDVRFVLCTPFVAETGKLNGTPSFPQRAKIIAAMDSTITAIAKDYDATLVPFDSLFTDIQSKPAPSDTYWIWDGIHPTPAAHYRMADMWIQRQRCLPNEFQRYDRTTLPCCGRDIMTQ